MADKEQEDVTRPYLFHFDAYHPLDEQFLVMNIKHVHYLRSLLPRPFECITLNTEFTTHRVPNFAGFDQSGEIRTKKNLLIFAQLKGQKLDRNKC